MILTQIESLFCTCVINAQKYSAIRPLEYVLQLLADRNRTLEVLDVESWLESQPTCSFSQWNSNIWLLYP